MAEYKLFEAQRQWVKITANSDNAKLINLECRLGTNILNHWLVADITLNPGESVVLEVNQVQCGYMDVSHTPVEGSSSENDGYHVSHSILKLSV